MIYVITRAVWSNIGALPCEFSPVRVGTFAHNPSENDGLLKTRCPTRRTLIIRRLEKGSDAKMASSFDEAYRGSPPWDIGRPQAEFVKVAREGAIRGSVLDAGCGTGENAIFFASLGHHVWGLDSSPRAIVKAERKAAERKTEVKFVLGDALHLDRLHRRFDTITDCGLFHIFSDDNRKVYVEGLRAALNEEGTFVMLCFSDKGPFLQGGPRRVRKDEILEAFGPGWKIDYVREARFSTAFDDMGVGAWLSSITSV
jgi:SAM-dependent methyltransferase